MSKIYLMNKCLRVLFTKMMEQPVLLAAATVGLEDLGRFKLMEEHTGQVPETLNSIPL
jgi:hypothetical protein